MAVRLLMVEMDDWKGLYYEGILLHEGHDMETAWVMAIVQEFGRVSKLGVEYYEIFYDGEEDSPLFTYGDDKGQLQWLPRNLDTKDFNTLCYSANDTYYADLAKRMVQEALSEKPI